LDWQIGDGGHLAHLTGIDVINDFRSADVAAGGQARGPLMRSIRRPGAQGLRGPWWWSISRRRQCDYIDGDLVLAFDPVPECPDRRLDASSHRQAGRCRRRAGAQRRVNEAALARMLANPYFDGCAEIVGPSGFGIQAVEGLSPADGAATLAAFTAAAFARRASISALCAAVDYMRRWEDNSFS